MLVHGPIFLSSKKQQIIYLSSVEVDYRGAVNGATQCVWLQGILGELGFAFDAPTIIWCENKNTIKIYTSPL